MSENTKTVNGERSDEAPCSASYPELIRLLTNIFNAGYATGHQDTVESCYVDISSADIEDYHVEVIYEIIKDLRSGGHYPSYILPNV